MEAYLRMYDEDVYGSLISRTSPLRQSSAEARREAQLLQHLHLLGLLLAAVRHSFLLMFAHSCSSYACPHLDLLRFTVVQTY